VIEAIIFDLYGVLALNGWQAFKAEHFTERPQDWAELFELGRRVDAGLADTQELIRQTALKTGTTEAHVRYQLEHTVANRPLLDYISAELKPHYKIAILSNASTDVIPHIFTEEQTALFDAITLSYHVHLTKPQPEMYLKAAEALGVDPANCLHIDDQERHVAGAREAGLQALLFTGLETFKQDVAAQ
jgi:HAD superfamily hydrolase (TIGR01509 family)